jgi:hypothetical protein
MSEEQKPRSDVVKELEALGSQLVTAVKAMWDSEESRQLRQEIGDGFVDLGQKLDDAIKSAQDSEAAQELGEQFRETVDKARESDLAGKVQRNLTTGLQQLNAELSKLVESLESGGKAAPSAGEVDPEADADAS